MLTLLAMLYPFFLYPLLPTLLALAGGPRAPGGLRVTSRLGRGPRGDVGDTLDAGESTQRLRVRTVVGRWGAAM